MAVKIKAKKAQKEKKARTTEKSMILTENSPWSIQEAYKQLRTNVLFSLTGTGCKVIGVTSAFTGDGKSINAINHAISFAQLGKRVLLIDGDMRRPTIAAKLHIKGKPGLSDVLVGQAKAETGFRRLTQFGIDVIPSGSIPPDSTWLLQSKRMEILMQELKKVFDYIIIDLPPVTLVADASIVAPYCDGFLFVVRHNSTDRRLIASALQQLDRAGARVLGFVYNDAAPGEGHYGSYSYKYKYQSNKE
jgi:capsular exopolysaccharide synthesis family protein